MKLIGITGGIGSGKSLICRIFAVMGIPVYEADSRAKWLITNDILLKNQLIQLLGSDAYLPDGGYNRTWVASQVFNNPTLLSQVNAIVHPRVHADAQQWATQHANIPFALYEAALIKASDKGERFEKIVVVNAPLDLRIKRIRERDSRSEEEIKQIISRQMPDIERLAMADVVIENDEQKPLLWQVLSLMNTL